MSNPEHLSIGEVAELTGLSVHTLRFYEREGLFAHPVHRAPGGHRAYTQRHVDWVRLCSRLRMSGMPLHAIRHYAELVAAGPGNEAQRLELLREHQKRVAAQIAELTGCMEMIDFKVDHYANSLHADNRDPFWNADEVAATG